MKNVIIKHTWMIENNVTHYTTVGGGHWKEVGILCDELLTVHALRFTSGSDWDCVNGYRIKENACCCDRDKYQENRMIDVAAVLYTSKKCHTLDEAIELAELLIRACHRKTTTAVIQREEKQRELKRILESRG